jgi:hypothetical protein
LVLQQRGEHIRKGFLESFQDLLVQLTTKDSAVVCNTIPDGFRGVANKIQTLALQFVAVTDNGQEQLLLGELSGLEEEEQLWGSPHVEQKAVDPCPVVGDAFCHSLQVTQSTEIQ